jgi:hypothetical protein
MMIDGWLVEQVRAKLRADIERFEGLSERTEEEDALTRKGRESSILALRYALSMLDNIETAEVPHPLSPRRQLRRLRDTLTEAAASALEEAAWWLHELRESPRYERRDE